MEEVGLLTELQKRNHRFYKLKLSLDLRIVWLLMFTTIAVTSEAQTAKQIVTNYLQAIGGADRWGRVTSKLEEGFFVKTPSKSSQLFNIESDTLIVVMKHKRPNRYFHSSFDRIDSSYSILCFNGEIFWTKIRGQLEIQSKEDSEYFKQVSMIGLADVLLESSTIIEYLGREKLKGIEFHTLKVKRKGWLLSQKIYFDPITGLPFCSTVIDSLTKRYTLFKDYRNIDGIILHYSEEVYDEKWNLESIATFIKIELNTTIPDNDFEAINFK
ncbi:MAG TPA: hypothetical protein PKC10_01640 [Cyclobacteriaceae bacterium]|nr:hypothetical protein [Cyclobacteriaceae bacterium]